MPAKIFIQLEVDYADETDVAKLARYGRDARAIRDLLVQMWCHCKQHLTDGYVSAEAVGKLVYPDPPKIGIRDADRLVDVGIATATDDGGYYLTGFLKRNKSRAQVNKESAAKAEAGRLGGIKSGQTRSKREANAKQGASTPTNTEYIEHSSEFIVQSSKTLGVGSPSVPDAIKAPTRCPRHEAPHHSENCGACKAWRLALEDQTARDDLAAKRAKAAAKRAQEACTACDPGGWIKDTDPAVKCTHNQSERTTA